MSASPYKRPDWREPILVGPRSTNRRLLAAFLTTFNSPQATVLVQDLLPDWLGLSSSYVEEGADKLRFYAELEDGLKRLRGRFSIISSPGQQDQDGHGWIWRYISRLQVGYRQPAVQHAKLWMFHHAGQDGGPETLEVIVSSQNLTKSGFRDQIQAGWRCVVALDEAAGPRRRQSWGVLPDFLEELAEACGKGGKRAVPYWQALLERAACPGSATFVASVPGRHPLKPVHSVPAWGVAALRRLGGRRNRSLTAMVPTIGNWNGPSLRNWMEAAGLGNSVLGIAWLERAHPWAGQWQLNDATALALSSEATWLQLPLPHGLQKWRSPLCEEHRPGDTRWSHAKLYELASQTGQQLVCTSANFSRAAWGQPLRDGTVQIDNFELGVAIPADAGLARQARKVDFIPATCEGDFEAPVDQPIAWAAVEWDGASLRIHLRLAPGALLHNRAVVEVAGKANVNLVSLPVMRASGMRLDWSLNKKGIPVRIKLTTTAGHFCEVAVEDVRPIEPGEWLSEAGTVEELQDAADQMLEEKYGFFDEGGGPPPNRQVSDAPPGSGGASYSVAAYEDSRRRFAAVDHWVEILGKASAQTRPGVLDDGQRIADRWLAAAGKDQREDIARSAILAAGELRGRLRGEGRKQ